MQKAVDTPRCMKCGLGKKEKDPKKKRCKKCKLEKRASYAQHFAQLTQKDNKNILNEMSDNFLLALSNIWYATENFTKSLKEQGLAEEHAITFEIDGEQILKPKWKNKKAPEIIGYKSEYDFEAYYDHHKNGHTKFARFFGNLTNALHQGHHFKEGDKKKVHGMLGGYNMLKGPTKKPARAWFKYVCKYKFNAFKIKDLQRGTITFDNKQDLQEGLNKIIELYYRDDNEFSNAKISMIKNGWNSYKEGQYCDVKIIFTQEWRKKTLCYEVQLMTEKMLELKEILHKGYDQIRIVPGLDRIVMNRNKDDGSVPQAVDVFNRALVKRRASRKLRKQRMKRMENTTRATAAERASKEDDKDEEDAKKRRQQMDDRTLLRETVTLPPYNRRRRSEGRRDEDEDREDIDNDDATCADDEEAKVNDSKPDVAEAVTDGEVRYSEGPEKDDYDEYKSGLDSCFGHWETQWEKAVYTELVPLVDDPALREQDGHATDDTCEAPMDFKSDIDEVADDLLRISELDIESDLDVHSSDGSDFERYYSRAAERHLKPLTHKEKEKRRIERTIQLKNLEKINMRLKKIEEDSIEEKAKRAHQELIPTDVVGPEDEERLELVCNDVDGRRRLINRLVNAELGMKNE